MQYIPKKKNLRNLVRFLQSLALIEICVHVAIFFYVKAIKYKQPFKINFENF